MNYLRYQAVIFYVVYQNTKYYARAELAQYLWIKQYRLQRPTFEFGGKGTAACTRAAANVRERRRSETFEFGGPSNRTRHP